MTLNVTVTDESRRYVTDLEQHDFEIFEDGRKQELMFFQKSGVPLALVLLLDTSASMQEQPPCCAGSGHRICPWDSSRPIRRR